MLIIYRKINLKQISLKITYQQLYGPLKKKFTIYKEIKYGKTDRKTKCVYLL
jgi:hypothetical protein